MKTYISILRGINVGGQNAIKMEALREMYCRLGFSDVQSYIQSGNVIFRTEETDTKSLGKSISAEILKTFDCEISVLVLERDEWRNALKNNIFLNDSSKNPDFIHLTFLSDLPNKNFIEKISDIIYFPDEYCIVNKVVYLYCPSGYGNTKLSNSFFERKLKLCATTRNLKTSNELLKLADSI
ncbi:MAG: DUF1697 domain-containing protein [Paludibacter sp.]